MHTVAIPAYNSAADVDRLLGEVVGSIPTSVREVVVCDNASTDDTADVVRKWAGRGPLVRLVSEGRPGKPAAWNRLVEESRTDLVIFLDADVWLRRHTLAQLVAATRESNHLVYCARRHFSGEDGSSRVAAALADPVVELCVAGPCYVIRKAGVTRRMATMGFAKMPDVFAEDIWLQACMERRDVKFLNDCAVDLRLDSLDTYLMLHARRRLVDYELDNTFPALGKRLRTNFPAALGPWAQLYAVLDGHHPMPTKLRWLAGAGAKGVVNQVFRRRIHEDATALVDRYHKHGGGHVLRSLSAGSALDDPATLPSFPA